MPAKAFAPRNRTLQLSNPEISQFKKRFLDLREPCKVETLVSKTICCDIFETLRYLPKGFVDLLFVDPPYNLTKDFNGAQFKEMTDVEYEQWLASWFAPLMKTLKPTASVYVCGDWKSSAAIYRILSKHLHIRNRITWEREKGRGAKANWKNCSEDIWFATVSNEFTFNSDKVMLKRKVLAPYKDPNGAPKDWQESENGNYRLTCPSNLWTDMTIPFWSMPENTIHPTQKPEKLLAKILLAGSNEGDFIFDPFLGSGTTSVVAKKLNRRYCGIEMNEEYACLAEKRLLLAESDKTIQGYHDGVFWERNSLSEQKKANSQIDTVADIPDLFAAM